MTDTSFVPNPAQLTRRAAMHQREIDGSLAPIDFLFAGQARIFPGGSGLVSDRAGLPSYARDWVTGRSGSALLWRVGHLDAVSEGDAGEDFRQLVVAPSAGVVWRSLHA
jgi:methyl acetate hydrolase